ncbi:MAG: hypothetical protein WA324_10005 [Bryobacteraceae bacterium]
MAAPLMPPPLDEIGRRRFAFYPCIWNLEPNEWMLSSATWVDAQVVNVRTGQQIAVPRRYIGAVSETDDPILIVGLTKELEFRENCLWPRVRRVIEMPVAVNQTRPFRIFYTRPEGPAPVVGIRLENRLESRASKLLTTAGIGAVVVSLLVVGVVSTGIIDGRPGAHPVWQSSHGFTEYDTYASVTRRLGPPAADWQVESKDGHWLRILDYSNRRVSVVLLEGNGKEEAHYLGAIDRRGHIVHAIPQSTALNPGAILASVRAVTH